MCRCDGASEHTHLGANTTTIRENLHPYIDFRRSTLNDRQRQRTDLPKLLRAKFMDDPSFLIVSDGKIVLKISFIDACRIKSIGVSGLGISSFSAFNNMIATEKTSLQPTQTFTFKTNNDASDLLQFETRAVLFNKCKTLSIVINAKESQNIALSYVSLTGEFLAVVAKPVQARYELKPQTADHGPLETALQMPD